MQDDELTTGLDRNEFFAVYQPVVSVPSRQVVGAEVLARWEHPEHGTLPPGEFITTAEDGGAIHGLGLQMLRTAWRAAEDWNTPASEVGISVNVSAVQFTETALDGEVAQLVEHSSLPARMLTLEITESRVILDTPAVARRLAALRELGVGISVDDFGVGYSSWERVAELPLSELKIDISMVQDETDAGYGALLDVVEYAHEHDLQIVAEGVETEEQMHRVELLRCHRAQGYLFGRPMPAAEFLHRIRPGVRRSGS